MLKAITQNYFSSFKGVMILQLISELFSCKESLFREEKLKNRSVYCAVNNLSEAETNKEYTIKEVVSEDKEITNFLFSLGCFKGQSVTVVAVLSETYVIAIKDARYSIDADLAKAIILV